MDIRFVHGICVVSMYVGVRRLKKNNSLATAGTGVRCGLRGVGGGRCNEQRIPVCNRKMFVDMKWWQSHAESIGLRTKN